MQGTVAWWNVVKRCGIAEVWDESTGIVQKYFLLFSRIASSPKEIKPGQFCKFEKFSMPMKAGLLPMALGVDISDKPFETASTEAV